MGKEKTLASLRAENNLTQRELAKKLNISAGTIGMYESGKRTPSLRRAIEIAKIFNVSVESISFSTSNNKNGKQYSQYNLLDYVKKKDI